MHDFKKCRGFTWLELMITLSIVIILGAFALPSYINYTRRAYFREVITPITAFQEGVAECYQLLKKFKGCSGGRNHVPPNITKKTDTLTSLTVIDGVITVIPAAGNAILASDTYILTPKPFKKTKSLNHKFPATKSQLTNFQKFST
jgi:type IV pilus assembly protein PilA